MTDTICTECRHHQQELNQKDFDVWYIHKCRASPLPRNKNFVTGETPEQDYEYCSRVNKGSCSQWRKK